MYSDLVNSQLAKEQLVLVSIEIAASKSVKFKASKALKDAVK